MNRHLLAIALLSLPLSSLADDKNPNHGFQATISDNGHVIHFDNPEEAQKAMPEMMRRFGGLGNQPQQLPADERTGLVAKLTSPEQSKRLRDLIDNLMSNPPKAANGRPIARDYDASIDPDQIVIKFKNPADAKHARQWIQSLVEKAAKPGKFDSIESLLHDHSLVIRSDDPARAAEAAQLVETMLNRPGEKLPGEPDQSFQVIITENAVALILTDPNDLNWARKNLDGIAQRTVGPNMPFPINPFGQLNENQAQFNRFAKRFEARAKAQARKQNRNNKRNSASNRQFQAVINDNGRVTTFTDPADAAKAQKMLDEMKRRFEE